MSETQLKKIVIVGGGTAGWMAAAAFSKLLDKNIEIVLIESEQIGTVGVGEATIPNILTFNRLLGIDESDFMRETNATFKLGIEFVNWSNVGERYMHPFGNFGMDINSVPFHHYWIKAQLAGMGDSFFDYSIACQAAPKLKFSHPKNIENSPLSGIKYAYHFDAGLYAGYLRKYAEANGVKRIEGIVENVQCCEQSGYIKTLSLENNARIHGDFFIDCSGFRGLLISQALGVPYVDFSHWLPCDRAVAMPCERSEHTYPYTRSTAHQAGWQWRIPLQHRIGNGHVYCSNFCDDDKALETLASHLDGEPCGEPNFIKFTTGKRARFWEKNCVALGLASGFLEPLESTSIHLIQSGIIKLLGMFPGNRINQVGIDKYNKEAEFEFERIRDFLILHYYVNQRTDSDFWRYCREMPVPDSLLEKISLFEEVGHCTRDANELFSHPSWLAVMIGQGLKAKGYNRVVDSVSDTRLKEHLAGLKAVIQRSAGSLPNHDDYIRRYCATP